MSKPQTDEDIARHASATLPPYAHGLGMAVDGVEAGAPVIGMDFADKAQGRPGYFHGGAIAGLLEMAGFAALKAELDRQGRTARLKPINLSTNFLRGAKQARIFAVGRVTRAGRRSANVEIEAWQGSRAEPVAEAVLNILIVEPDA